MSSSIKPLCAAGCGKDGILRCGLCLDALYCNKECQAKMWQQHKGPCKEMAAAKEKAKADEAAEAKAKQEADDIQTLCSAGCGEVALERCALCAGAKYCGKECQNKHWPEHKGPCKMTVQCAAESSKSVEQFQATFEKLKRAAEAGNVDAQKSLGMSYITGLGHAQIDKTVAIKWLTLASDAGNQESKAILSSLALRI